MQKIHVGCSPLTGTIFAGKILKDGRTWAAGKEDVTLEALVAVAQHAIIFGKPIEISRADGTGIEFRITTERSEDLDDRGDGKTPETGPLHSGSDPAKNAGGGVREERHGHRPQNAADARMRKNIEGQSATSLADCLGVDVKAVTRAINTGKLRATRRGTARTEAQGGDHWYILDKNVREYILDNLIEIDIRKVDKYWFVDLVSGGRSAG